MDFIASSDDERKVMLKVCGVTTVEELFDVVPEQLRCPPPLEDDGMSESEGMRHMEAMAAKNCYIGYDSYLGGGAYHHHIPAIVSAICSKSEFLTSYTPYQAEVSQGLLQAIFEFQTAIAALTGLDIANASVYDGASSCGEAALMALRLRPGRKCFLIADTVHPHYRAVVAQYLRGTDAEIVTVNSDSHGIIQTETLESLLSEDVAALLLQSPNVFGLFEASQQLFTRVHDYGALALLAANPLVYGLFSSAGELGADIAVGDCQPLGLPLHFGGPYVGYMACRKPFVRQLPGRLVGATTDNSGARGFVLTLQAREQHIRRERATSNLCTNQALAALAATVTMVWYGPEGLHNLALTNYRRMSYLRRHLRGFPGIHPETSESHFNECIVTFDLPIDAVCSHFRKANILPGIPLGRWYPQWHNSLLVCVTEMKTEAQLDHYIATAQRLQSSK